MREPSSTTYRVAARCARIAFTAVWLLSAALAHAGTEAAGSQSVISAQRGEAAVVCSRQAGDEKRRCYEGLLTGVATRQGVEHAMSWLLIVGDLDPDVKREGHVLAHAVGITGYRATKDVTGTFLRCSDQFQSGCYHGVIQAYLEEGLDASTSANSEFLDGLCRPYRQDHALRWMLFQCVHGLGHGLTTYLHHDLPKALEACDQLSDDWDRHACYGGAFMENVIHFTMPEHGFDHHAVHASMAQPSPDAVAYKGIDPRDPFYPCSALAERYVEDCYHMQTSIMLHLNHGDVGATAATCDRAPDARRVPCYISLGRDISGYAVQDIQESVRLCSLGVPSHQPWCFFGLVKNFIDVTATTTHGMALCRAARGFPNKAKCYEAVGEQIWVLEAKDDGREARCLDAEPEYRVACRYGARLPE